MLSNKYYYYTFKQYKLLRLELLEVVQYPSFKSYEELNPPVTISDMYDSVYFFKIHNKNINLHKLRKLGVTDIKTNNEVIISVNEQFVNEFMERLNA